MIRYDVQQGSPEWITLRLGIPTASRFGPILAKARGLSRGGDVTLLYELLVEYFLGAPYDPFASGFVGRGSKMEKRAFAQYEWDHDLLIDHPGFITNDAGTWGCSPDGFVGDEGMIEIKCLGAKTHIAALLGRHDNHEAQIQGQLLVCERRWTDLFFYHPTLPTRSVRIERDDEIVADLERGLNDFGRRLFVAKETLLALGCVPHSEKAREPDAIEPRPFMLLAAVRDFAEPLFPITKPFNPNDV